jgi:hypothetical protein
LLCEHCQGSNVLHTLLCRMLQPRLAQNLATWTNLQLTSSWLSMSLSQSTCLR